MVGRTRLHQGTRSPLISGTTAKQRRLWPWVVTVLVILAAAGGVWWYVTYVR
jgi:hypothetical protein